MANDNNRANQMNPNHPAYASSRKSNSAHNVNRSKQLNPNNAAYAKSSGKN